MSDARLSAERIQRLDKVDEASDHVILSLRDGPFRGRVFRVPKTETLFYVQECVTTARYKVIIRADPINGGHIAWAELDDQWRHG
jgi:hypothetical protein